MILPLKYSLRNLLVRRGATLMTVLGIAAAATIFLTVFGLRQGMRRINARTGTPRHVLVLRQGPPVESASSIEMDKALGLRNLAGIARDETGEPLCAAEIVTAMNLPRRGGGGSSNVTVRGTQTASPALREQFTLVEGRPFRPGLNELLVARNIAERFAGLELGGTVRVGATKFDVVGVFTAGESAYDSEIWADFEVVRQVFHRADPSSVLLQAASDKDARELIRQITGDTARGLKAQTLAGYYAEISKKTDQVLFFSKFLAIVLGIGAIFAAANTMYAAVAQRAPEIGVLRAIGYRRLSILLAFLLESALLGFVGGVLGAAVALGISLSGFKTGTTNWWTFSEQTFGIEIGGGLLAIGLLFGTLVGALGGLFPALQASRRTLLEALRAA